MRTAALYDQLSPEGRTLLSEAISHLEQRYDPTAGLVSERFEGRAFQSLRNSLYYALGLLLRGDANAVEKASRICRAVLDMQLIAPGEVWHGAFRHPDMPPPAGAAFIRPSCRRLR